MVSLTDKGKIRILIYSFTMNYYTFLLNLSTNLFTRLSISQTDSFDRIKSERVKLSELNSYLHHKGAVTVFLSEEQIFIILRGDTVDVPVIPETLQITIKHQNTER